MFTVGCSHSALCCQSIKKQLIFRVVWEFQCHFQQVIGPVEKCCCRTLPSPSHKRLRDNPYHPGHLQNGDVQNQSATLFWLYEPLLHSTVHQKEYQVSSEYFHKHSWISQHPPLFLCSCILTPSNTSNDSNALPGEIGISSNLIPRLPWESSIVEYNRLVNLLVIKKGVLSWDLWRMKDPSELTKNMFLFGCFCSIVSQLTADGTKQNQLFGTRPQNHDHLPKTQISFLNKKLFLLSIFSVRRCDYKGKDLSLSIPSSHRSLPTSTQLHPFTNKMTKPYKTYSLITEILQQNTPHSSLSKCHPR